MQKYVPLVTEVFILGRQIIDQKRKKGWRRGRRERIAVPPTLGRLGAFSIFLPFFSIVMAISVFLIFLTGVTSNSRRWDVVKLSVSPKRPFFFFLLTRCSLLFPIPIAHLHLAKTFIIFIGAHLNFFLLSALYSKRAG